MASQPAGSSGTGAVGTAPATAAGVTGDLEVASVALAYLRQLLATVGARGGGFVESFRFRVREIVVGGRQRRRRRGAGNENGDDDDDDDDYYSDSQASRTSGSAAADTDALAGRFANEQSVWSSGSDLWHVVGWALGCCTVLHKHRWRVWRPWLAMLLDVIESDWEERKQGRGHGNVGTDGGQTSGVEKTSAGLENSMLIRFLVDNVGRGSTAVKRAVRAIFAGTDRLSLSQYHPVFEREAMIRRVADETGERKRKRSDMLDLKNDKFGDYFADDDDDDSVPSSQQSIPGLSGSGGAGIVSNNTLVEALGDSLVLRYRLLDLVCLFYLLVFGSIQTMITLSDPDTQLIQAARDAPEHFSPMQALCFEIGRTLNAVPLDVFEAFVLHAPPEVPRSSVLCILESAAALLLPDNIRASAASGRVRTSSSTMDLATLRDRYACHAAGTASAGDNARLSLLIEKSLLVLWTAPDDDGGHEVARKSASEIDLDEVRLAVKRGIAARDSRWKKPRLVATAASSRQRGRPSKTRQSNHAAAEDPPGAATLRESAARIIEILDIMQAAAGGVTDADMDVDSAGE